MDRLHLGTGRKLLSTLSPPAEARPPEGAPGSGVLHLVVALRAEARPIFEDLRLVRDPASAPFDVFHGELDGAATALVISGPGKAAAAAATAWLGRETLGRGGGQAAWLNVGVAGHGHLEVGESMVAHAVEDRATGETWYPSLVADPGGATGRVITVDRVERRYAEDGAYEMEASAYFPIACRFASAELVHCFKIVSDGPGTAIEKLTARHLEALVNDQLPRLRRFAASLAELAATVRELGAEPPELVELEARWRFTVTERRQLRRLVERWRARRPGIALPVEELSTRRGKDVLRHLRACLDRLPVDLGLERTA